MPVYVCLDIKHNKKCSTVSKLEGFKTDSRFRQYYVVNVRELNT